MLVPQWYYIPPPYDQKKPISLSAPPIGAVRTDSIKAKETIQVIGRARAKVPSKVEVDLGWADIYIINGREIDFKSGGEFTNIGVRVPETTRGMSISGEGGEVLDIDEPSEILQGINRPAMRKKAPRRKANKRKRDYGDYTVMQGLRW